MFTYRKELTPFMQRKKGSILLYQTFAFLMVRMTGFEPTRLSTLEPETSASAVPPHPHFKFFVLYFYTGRTPEAVLTIELDSFSIFRKLYKNAFLRVYQMLRLDYFE